MSSSSFPNQPAPASIGRRNPRGGMPANKNVYPYYKDANVVEDLASLQRVPIVKYTNVVES
jgi:hypothetical protein